MVAEECIKTKSRMIFAPPDIYFGDGSINGILKSSTDKDSVAVVAHVRVHPEMLTAPEFVYLSQKGEISNARLVKYSWQHLHRCWGDAEKGHPRQNQFGTGVCWKKIEDNLYSVIHRLPTPYAINLTEEDLQYFKLHTGFGHFDHRWPGDLLIPRGRQRYVTSSDVAFMAELTEPHKNISNPPTHKDGTPGDPNDFWVHHLHNEMNKQTLVTFRGE
jgi:hypothetical protein